MRKEKTRWSLAKDLENKMSRFFLAIAICFLTIVCLNGHAANSAQPNASAAYSAAFLRGADHACKQPEHATTHFANMLQASCIAADMRAGKDPADISRHCHGAYRRSTFETIAAEICSNSQI
jgi:hypothetical protein